MLKLSILALVLVASSLFGCLLDPEKKPDKIIYVDCSGGYDGPDSAGHALWICPVNDSEPTPPSHPK